MNSVIMRIKTKESLEQNRSAPFALLNKIRIVPASTRQSGEAGRDYSRGFTLVEIVIVVGVLLLMSGLLMIYTQKGGKQIALYRDHAALNQQLLRARGFSTAKVRPEDELVCAYGISIANNGKSYTVFKDLPVGSSCPGDFAYQFPDEKIDTISTDSLVTISNATLSTIVFTPGLTAVYFDGERAAPGDEARIPVRLDDTTQKMTIVINHLGQMFTE